VTVNPPNLRHLLEGQIGGAGGTYADMARRHRQTGELPGLNGMPGGTLNPGLNSAMPAPVAPQDPNTPLGSAPSRGLNFDADAFKKRLGQMGRGWAMGQNPSESLRFGNLAMSLGDQLPDDKTARLMWLLQMGRRQ
jgi:hypothetical protein